MENVKGSQFVFCGEPDDHQRTQTGSLLRSPANRWHPYLVAYHVAVSRVLLPWLATTPIREIAGVMARVSGDVDWFCCVASLSPVRAGTDCAYYVSFWYGVHHCNGVDLRIHFPPHRKHNSPMAGS